jgi:integrative and conjugative element protein (TIGR02256 family)
MDLTAFDLVIDATADGSVRAGIELHRKGATFRPPLVTMVIGHQADLGLVATALPSATGAAADAFRKVSLLASSGAEDWVEVGEDLFPSETRTELFFPEPGCSSPTFVGSSAQSAALAGLMLHEAFTALREATNSTPPGTEPQVTFTSAVRLGRASTRGTSRASWPADTDMVDQSGAYEVRVTAGALAVARDEVRHGAELREPAVETGGMLLGAFDDAIGVVYVDTVAGPPPDSYLAEKYFQHGLEGVQERVDLGSERTGRTLGFVGFWHSHPYGPAYPSDTDEQGMATIVAPDDTTRQALMMILGGNKACWEQWRDSDAAVRPDLYLRVVPRSPATAPPYGPVRVVRYIGGLDLQRLPPGSYYRGTGKKRVQVGAGGRILSAVGGGPRRWSLPWKRT